MASSYFYPSEEEEEEEEDALVACLLLLLLHKSPFLPAQVIVLFLSHFYRGVSSRGKVTRSWSLVTHSPGVNQGRWRHQGCGPTKMPRGATQYANNMLMSFAELAGLRIFFTRPLIHPPASLNTSICKLDWAPPGPKTPAMSICACWLDNVGSFEYFGTRLRFIINAGYFWNWIDGCLSTAVFLVNTRLK